MNNDNDNDQEETNESQTDSTTNEQLSFNPIEKDRNRHLSDIVSDIRDHGPTPPTETESSEVGPDVSPPITSAATANGEEQSNVTETPSAALAGRGKTASVKPLATMIGSALLATMLVTSIYWLYSTTSEVKDNQDRLTSQIATLSSDTDRPENISIETERIERLVLDNKAVQTELKLQIDALRQQQSEFSKLLSSIESEQTTMAQQKDRSVDIATATTEPAKPKMINTPSQSRENWFVNVGSYSKEASAQNLAKQIDVEKSDIQIVAVRSAGNLLYRVRVTGLDSREAATQLAQQLAKDLSLKSTLWVGKE